MDTLVYFPRGYRLNLSRMSLPEDIPEANEDHINVSGNRHSDVDIKVKKPSNVTWLQGSSTIAELYKHYYSTNYRTNDPDFVLELQSLMSNYIPCFNGFVTLQNQNDHVYGMTYEFLNSILNYSRFSFTQLKLSPDSVMAGSVDYPSAKKVANRTLEYPLLDGSRSVNWSSKWISKPNGLECAVNTMYLLFGPVRNG